MLRQFWPFVKVGETDTIALPANTATAGDLLAIDVNDSQIVGIRFNSTEDIVYCFAPDTTVADAAFTAADVMFLPGSVTDVIPCNLHNPGGAYKLYIRAATAGSGSFRFEIYRGG